MSPRLKYTSFSETLNVIAGKPTSEYRFRPWFLYEITIFPVSWQLHVFYVTSFSPRKFQYPRNHLAVIRPLTPLPKE